MELVLHCSSPSPFSSPTTSPSPVVPRLQLPMLLVFPTHGRGHIMSFCASAQTPGWCHKSTAIAVVWCGVGCHMGNHYTGVIRYADDLTLLIHPRSGLKVLIEICEQYADDYCVKFNSAKSMYLVFRGRKCKPDNRTVVFNGTELQSVQDAVHMDHRVSTFNKDNVVDDGIAEFWRGYNMFMGDFGHIKTAVKCKLFKQYCCSYYGAPLWDLQSKSVGNICIAWRKALMHWHLLHTAMLSRCCLIVCHYW